MTCQENFIKLNEKVFEGNDIKKSIVKSILEYKRINICLFYENFPKVFIKKG